MSTYDALRTGLETAYIDATVSSNLALQPQFVSNNYKEGRKVLSSIEEELLRCERFQISVAFITMGGITPLLQTLKELEKRGVPGQILTTNYLDFSEPRALQKLNELSNITLKMYDVDTADHGFHTKGYIFQKGEIYRIILGSSNMTAAALTCNVEWNTKLLATTRGEVASQIVEEFQELWDSPYALSFDAFYEVYRTRYEIIKHQREEARKDAIPSFEKFTLKPNSMQEVFIANLRAIMEKGENRALLISATGTGKTYASAFAMRELGFRRVLFLVHRAQLAKQARKSFERVFNNSVSMGIVGAGAHEYDSDFIFAMVETLNRDAHLFRYEKDAFDCIILDEAHHSPANTYQKVMEYFTPKLFLGMTATPDKRDDAMAGRNVYELFDYQIAHEIRLQKAMEDQLLCPFHYFGISDLAVMDEKNASSRKLSETDFAKLTSDERVDHVLEQAQYFGYSGDRVRGLVFCSRNRECEELAAKFNERGYRTVALSGDTPQEKREEAFERLAMRETEAAQVAERKRNAAGAVDEKTPLDYIFSVDILNEGVDIVEVNQVILLRPTQSPIVFIQQLGRGLRKADGKDYVVILDFIGNYSNNFMIPVALSGDRTYNADVIRKYVISGNNTIPGASTVHFDEVAKEKIFHAIDNLRSGTMKALIREGYENLKNRLGRRPMLLDFYENEEVDPLVIIKEYGTYYAFISTVEKNPEVFHLNNQEKLTLEYLSKTILSGVHPDEAEILRLFLERNQVSYAEIVESCRTRYDYVIAEEEIDAACDVLSGNFVINEKEHEKFRKINLLEMDGKHHLRSVLRYAERLSHKDFYDQLQDIISVALARFQDKYAKPYGAKVPFTLYEKYSRRDVSILINAGKDLSSTMYGMYGDGEDVFLFVTYHKEETTDADKQYVDGKPDYADEFIDNSIFRWDSQIGKKLDGEYMNKVLHTPRKHLFVQKTDKENNFFYMGEFDVIEKHQEEKKSNQGVMQPICKLKLQMHTPVREDILQYLQSNVLTEGNAV